MLDLSRHMQGLADFCCEDSGDVYTGKKALEYSKQICFRISWMLLVPARRRFSNASARSPKPAARQALACA